MRRNIYIITGILILSYMIIFMFAPESKDYTIADTEYWRETNNRILLNVAYDYNDKSSIESFPRTLGEWKGSDYKYPEYVYKKLNADILLSREYRKDKNIIWMDIINSKTGESFHKQKICVEGAGWTIDKESIAKFDVGINSRLGANRLDISKGNKKQLMVYWFMFKKFGDTDQVSMIRLSSPVYNNNTERAFDSMKSFVEKQLFFEMYKEYL